MTQTKYIIRVSVLLMVYGIASSLVSSQSQNAAGPTEWKRYHLGKGAFSVLFPVKPTEEFKASPPSVALPIDLYVTSVATAGGIFLAQYSVLGDATEKWKEETSETFLWRRVDRALFQYG